MLRYKVRLPAVYSKAQRLPKHNNNKTPNMQRIKIHQGPNPEARTFICNQKISHSSERSVCCPSESLKQTYKSERFYCKSVVLTFKRSF